MDQHNANKIFGTSIGQQLDVIYVVSDDKPFIRRIEAEDYCRDTLGEGDDVSKYNITEWYPTEDEDSEIKKRILSNIDTMCSNFLYYDRKEDSELSIERLDKAILNGEITIDEMVAEFKRHLDNSYSKKLTH